MKAPRKAKSMTKKEDVDKDNGSSLMSMPMEILLRIMGHAVRDFAPSTMLVKRAEKNDTTTNDPRTLQRVADDDFRRLQTWLSMKYGPNLEFLQVNRMFYSAGIDVLYRINTITLTSRETKSLMEQPGMTGLFTNLRIYERSVEESIFIDKDDLNTNCKQNKDMLRKILEVPRLRSLAIDIEAFFMMLISPPEFYEVYDRGLKRFLRDFGLVDLVQWRCTGIGTYVLVPRPDATSETKAKNPISCDSLQKVTLCMPNITHAWDYVNRLHPSSRAFLAECPWLPRNGPFDPAWFFRRDGVEMTRPKHRLTDWMIVLYNDFTYMPAWKTAIYLGFVALGEVKSVFEGGEEMDDEVGHWQPGTGFPRVDHSWTMIFAAKQMEAKQMEARERKRPMPRRQQSVVFS